MAGSSQVTMLHWYMPASVPASRRSCPVVTPARWVQGSSWAFVWGMSRACTCQICRDKPTWQVEDDADCGQGPGDLQRHPVNLQTELPQQDSPCTAAADPRSSYPC